MPNKIVTLKSGAKLELQIAPFRIGTALYKAIANELKSVPGGLNLGDLSKQTKEGGASGAGLGNVLGPILQLLGSDKIEEAVLDCLSCGCLYDGKRINRDTFESPEARRDWIPAAQEVISYNLDFFFGDLDFGSFLPPSPEKTGSPK